MKSKVKSVIGSPLISGSFLLISGGVLANLFSFIFNFFMSRNLVVEDYGTFVSLVSIITLLSIPASALAPTIVTLAGNYFAEENLGMVHALYIKIIKILIVVSIFLFILFTVFAVQVASFFNIKDTVLLPLTAVAIMFSYIFTINLSFFQAKLSFKLLPSLSVFSSFTKLVFGVVLVLVGFGLSGAITSYLLSYVIPIAIGSFFLRKVLFHKSHSTARISLRELIRFGVPSAIIIFCLNSFINTDILLIKHLFSEKDAGFYAGLSLVGRVVFYVTAPVTTVMFPIIINKFKNGQPYKNILFAALGITAVMSVGITCFYFLFPQFTILFFLKKHEYLAIVNNLGMFGIFITLYSLISVLSYYYLAIRQTKVSALLVIGVVLQAGLIYFFHSSFEEVINISIFVSTLVIIGLLIFQKVFSRGKK